ncbi:Ig domain protein group 2 domain protein [Brevibacillus reuszeri]|uniref:Ig domain protein group 2 domain protein n=1 Tax=Brevibacillus reuszeri TaxID=54915 RepID=UPI00390889DB
MDYLSKQKKHRLSFFLLSLALFTGIFTLPLTNATVVKAEGPLDPAPVLTPKVVNNNNSKKILFDNTHGQTSGAADWVIDGGFSDFGDALADEGYYVTELRKTTPITLSDLEDYTVFVIGEANIPYKTSEQQAMLDYVENGGSIFFIGDHYNADRNKNRWDANEVFNGYRRGAWDNPAKGMGTEERNSTAMQNVDSSDWLGTNFGIRFRYNALGDITANNVVPSSESFGITSGVSTIAMHAGSTLAILDPNKAKGIVYLPTTNVKWASAVDQGVYNGGGINEGPYVAISKAGSGKAAFIGDSSPVEDATPKYKREENGATKKTYDGFKEQDDAQLLVNLINWLAEQESYTSFDQLSGFTPSPVTQLLAMEDPQTSTEPVPEPWAAPAAGYKWWDSSTFKPGSYGYSSSTPNPGTGQASEDFETGTKAAYAAGDVTLSSGSWNLNNALLGDTSADKKLGNQSVRARAAGSITMNFDVSNVTTVTISHANYGTDTGATWKLQKSVNAGQTWQDVSGLQSSTGTLQEQSFTVNEAGNVRFKIVVAGTSGKRLNFDNITFDN